MVWLIEDLMDLAKAISIYISQAVELLITCLIYPIQRILYWIGNILSIIIDAIMGLITSFYNIFYILYDFISSVVSGILPNAIVIIIMLAFTIVFLFRLYHFIKEVEIFGFKI